ncbi:MAG TPA: CdaR family protein [Vicinamibacterales bacterium]|jgi:YbbR domain-containing protein|nr:CdaR family protein [Vicinamibacterales bacterium]
MKLMTLFRHFGLKVLSVCLATLLWLVVSGEETVERGLRIPLELQQFPAGLELRTDSPMLVDVRVRGASGELSRMSAGDLAAVLDVKSARPGPRLYQLTPEQVRAPIGVEVVQVSPASISLTFEKSETREVPVNAVWDGTPAPGFAIGKVIVTPSTVEAEGPTSAIERVTEAVTEPVSVAGARSTVSEVVTVGFVDPLLRVKSPRPATVNIQVQIVAAKK